MRDILPKLIDLCEDAVPPHVAFDVYWGCRSLDDGLAAKAALVMAERARGDDARRRWRIHAAQELAQQGDESLLDEVLVEAGEHAEAWALLSYLYAALERWDDANGAAKKAVELDPTNREALSAIEEAHVRQGEVDAAIECAERLMELHPYEHVGPERLGALRGKRLEVDDALAHSHRAVDAAPFCHNAHWSRALAHFAAGDLELAAVHARRSLALEEPDDEDAGNDCLMILRAIEGDADGVRRCLDKLHESQPEAVFAEYKAKLVAVAGRSR
jgi:tetratricopeptide (TPR) repeat protein